MRHARLATAAVVTVFAMSSAVLVLAGTSPAVSSLSPAVVPSAGATVTVSGSGFAAADSVLLGAVAISQHPCPAPAATGCFTVVSDTSLTLQLGAMDAGTVDVVVRTAASPSTTSTADELTFAPPSPVVTAIAPAVGSIAGGQQVTVRGTGLVPRGGGVVEVDFGSTHVRATANPDGSLAVRTPRMAAGAVPVRVVVQSDDGAVGQSSQAGPVQFTFTDCAATQLCNPGGCPGGSPGAQAHACGWEGGSSLGGGPLDPHPQSVAAYPGATYTFWRGGDGSLHYAEYSGGSWHPAASLGGSLPAGASPHPVATGGGTVDVFWRGPDGNLWHVYELSGSGSWSAPSSLGGGPLGAAEPQPASSGSGDVAVFWRGTDLNLWEAAYRPGVGWQVPIALGSGPLGGTPRAAAFTTTSYDVFWRGTNDAIWHTYGSAGGWSGPQSLGMGPIAGDPVAVAASEYGIHLYWPGTDSGLWHAWFAGSWQGPQGLGGVVQSAPAPVVPTRGQVDVFWRGPNNDIWHLGRSGPSRLFEASLASTAVPAPVSWGGGHEEVFWQGADGNLWHDWAH